ncbi:hypothetical protein FGO68_gene7163 [Halteria grandinella]|uniref:Endonuclease/exonuclease/phosphatase domain-containing protein n=1 Tax=Halteria grandinella TaxID=5974 RepID=A0A8J8T006_HALGN|nr:hypothetical protein FGO68_gene7163 [Halteria grandinella]
MESLEQQILAFTPTTEPISLKILSLNILAQHLCDGELPAYPYINSKHQSTLQALRQEQLSKFFSEHKSADIFHLQEVGPLDEATVQNAHKSSLGSNFEYIISRSFGGTAKLQLVTIFNTLTLDKISVQDIYFPKKGKLFQFGLALQFRHKMTLETFHSINVHLNGGKTPEDKAIRTEQLKVLIENPIFKERNVVLTGDFNTELDELDGQMKGMGFPFVGPLEEYSPLHNTENRIQERQRDGHSGMAVVRRKIDAVFYCGFKKAAQLVPTANFESLVNSEALDRIESICKLKEDKEAEKQEKADLIKGFKEEIGLNLETNTVNLQVGFPNIYWFSDHLPVGACLTFT